MADVKWSDFPSGTTISDSDITVGLQTGSNVQWPFSAVAAYIESAIQGGALGTPSSGTLTHCTGLPISTGVSGLGTGAATFLATPTSANLKAMVTDETGSNALVFANSPTLVTPVIVGVTSGGNAVAGSVGQVVSNASTDVSMTSDTSVNITTLSLSPGDWDVSATVCYTPASSTSVTSTYCNISLTSATAPTFNGATGGIGGSQINATVTDGAPLTVQIPPFRVNVSVTTTVYLVGTPTFSVSTLVAGGQLYARRMR